jgi:hypothetical protein
VQNNQIDGLNVLRQQHGHYQDAHNGDLLQV